jgi:hypothetical protein
MSPGTAEVLDLLERGRAYLARPDVTLNQDGKYWTHDRTCVCAIGALMVVDGTSELYVSATLTVRAAWMVLDKALWAIHPERLIGIAEFNDGVARSKADVVAVFDRAITDLRTGVIQ